MARSTRQRAALRKAQLISARKRKGKHRFGGSGRKLSSSHKRAITIVATGSAVAGGALGAYNAYTHFKAKHPVQKPPGEVSWDLHEGQRRPYPYVTEWGKAGGGAAPSREVSREKTLNSKIKVRVRGSASKLTKDVMQELQGQRVAGGGKRAKYDVVQVSEADWHAEGLRLREILHSPASEARRNRRLDRGLPDY